jgi:hypothetical protein
VSVALVIQHAGRMRRILGAFVKLPKATISFVISARIGRVLIIFDISAFSKICRENSSFIKV